MKKTTTSDERIDIRSNISFEQAMWYSRYEQFLISMFNIFENIYKADNTKTITYENFCNFVYKYSSGIISSYV